MPVIDPADQMIAYTQKCVVAPLDTRIALLAAELLTCDAHFAKLPGVILLRKTTGS